MITQQDQFYSATTKLVSKSLVITRNKEPDSGRASPDVHLVKVLQREKKTICGYYRAIDISFES